MFDGKCHSTASLQVALIIGSCLFNVAWAQSPKEQRYPWDKRPATCTQASNAAAPECQLNSWSGWEITVGRIKLLYQMEEFALLERALEELSSSKRRFPTGLSDSYAIYVAFQELFPGTGAPSAERDRIARWRKAVPHSNFVDFADARLRYSEAWNARTHQYANNVSREAWALFAKHLGKGEQVLLAAPQRLKDTPIWHHLLLAISFDSNAPKSKSKEIFDRAVKKWPDYYSFYIVVLIRLLPQWGGSWEEVDDFIDYWSKQQARQEGTSLYARLYTELVKRGVPAGQMLMKWAKMKPSFVDLISRYPDPIYKNQYATYACFSRDKETFREAMKDLPQGVLAPIYWLRGYSYEQCVQWANL